MVCEGGTYGAGCKVACGNCRDVNQCSINNGTCLTGCDVGFKGDLCKTDWYNPKRTSPILKIQASLEVSDHTLFFVCLPMYASTAFTKADRSGEPL
eukprot:XP_019920657.1 PREDICTED: scavenger receptor class F member 2-like [Crassostrea gigas]